MRKERNSNLELYRIVMMLFIISHHMVVNSGLEALIYENSSTIMSMRSQLLLVLGAFGKAAINGFVLITGYFMCTKKISVEKFLKLFLEVIFYNVLLYVLFVLMGKSAFTVKNLFLAFIPIQSITNNFTSCFLVFYLLIPFLSAMVNNISRKQHKFLIILLVFVFTVLDLIPIFKVSINYVLWFSVLFVIASYFRLYENKVFDSARIWLVVTANALVLSVLSIVLFSYSKFKYNIAGPYYLLTDSNAPLALVLGVSSFLMFKNINIRNSKIINAIASTTFGVFLIHTNQNVAFDFLWKDIFVAESIFNSEYLILKYFALLLVIFIVCSIIDYLRIRFIEQKLISKLLIKIEKIPILNDLF